MICKNVKALILVFVAVFAILAAGCVDNSAKQAAPASAKKVVEFNYPELVYYDFIYLADELGYFKDAGVRPKYIGKLSTGQVIPSLVNGSIDVATRHTPVVIAAIASGADIQIFAAGSQSTKQWPHMKYFVKADSPIQSVKDFTGKTIGLNSFGACSEYVTKKYLLDNGVDPAGLKFKTAPEDQQEVPLMRGDTDIAIIHPPASGRATANIKDFKMLFSDWDIDKGISGMCPYSVNGKFLREHPEAVKELTEILIKTAKWNNANPDKAREIMAKRFNIAPEHAEMYEFYPDQLVPKEAVQYWIDRLIAEGKLTAGQVKLEQIYTNAYNPNKK
ncbi:ABC transporter substrate-binding protein [Acetonema longum]|uniref:NMT1/THI5 like domain protein n=1 Tax=Acetonema longum DSM 6540 TaxID=1009370 RepID=F7NHE3_9FIRM|nr:ABC transporter substrate-binding protein [Acetonema longum]EGO64626.1 NMT1/THI5 like domain protein [Acetonema longum DSM 6540]